jgi:hypothetical protein
LLRRVFNTCLSDRRDEGELFKLPQTAALYVKKLQKLVDEERQVYEQQKAAFASASFQIESPGPLFPSSWASAITGGRSSLNPVVLRSRSDYHYQTEVARFSRILPSLTPFFDKVTDYGARFRIYQTGTLQVRTVKEKDGQEEICAFLSKHSTSHENLRSSDDCLDEGIENATQYVDGDAANPQFFVVIETVAGNHIITEKRRTEPTVWEVNASNLEARIALAKVTRCVKCKDASVCAGDIQASVFDCANSMLQRPSLKEIRSFAQHAFDMVVPVTARSWEGLTDTQRMSILELGISEKLWDIRGIECLGLSWKGLSGVQRHHALVAGFDEQSWNSVMDHAKP